MNAGTESAGFRIAELCYIEDRYADKRCHGTQLTETREGSQGAREKDPQQEIGRGEKQLGEKAILPVMIGYGLGCQGRASPVILSSLHKEMI